MEATKTSYTHKYNPLGPSGFFITFHTYGTWLHGDSRGSMDRINNTPGTPMLRTSKNRVLFEKSELKQWPVTFTSAQRKGIHSTIIEVCTFKRWILHAQNVRTEHVHIVITTL